MTRSSRASRSSASSVRLLIAELVAMTTSSPGNTGGGYGRLGAPNGAGTHLQRGSSYPYSDRGPLDDDVDAEDDREDADLEDIDQRKLARKTRAHYSPNDSRIDSPKDYGSFASGLMKFSEDKTVYQRDFHMMGKSSRNDPGSLRGWVGTPPPFACEPDDDEFFDIRDPDALEEGRYKCRAPKRFDLPEFQCGARNTREAGDLASDHWRSHHGLIVDPFTIDAEKIDVAWAPFRITSDQLPNSARRELEQIHSGKQISDLYEFEQWPEESEYPHLRAIPRSGDEDSVTDEELIWDEDQLQWVPAELF